MRQRGLPTWDYSEVKALVEKHGIKRWAHLIELYAAAPGYKALAKSTTSALQTPMPRIRLNMLRSGQWPCVCNVIPVICARSSTRQKSRLGLTDCRGPDLGLGPYEYVSETRAIHHPFAALMPPAISACFIETRVK